MLLRIFSNLACLIFYSNVASILTDSERKLNKIFKPKASVKGLIQHKLSSISLQHQFSYLIFLAPTRILF
jgi:hypothetical protein